MYVTLNEMLEVKTKDLRQDPAYLRNKNIHIERKIALHYL